MYILLDCVKFGLIVVGVDGCCFVNEFDSYYDFCMGMVWVGLFEVWLIVDDDFIYCYGFGLVLLGGCGLVWLLW